MDLVHGTIGVLGAVALVVVIVHAASLTLVNTSEDIMNVAEHGNRAMDRVTPEQVSKNECGHSVCDVVQNIGHRVYVVLEIFASANKDGNEPEPSSKDSKDKKDPKDSKKDSKDEKDESKSPGDSDESKQDPDKKEATPRESAKPKQDPDKKEATPRESAKPKEGNKEQIPRDSVKSKGEPTPRQSAKK